MMTLDKIYSEYVTEEVPKKFCSGTNRAIQPEESLTMLSNQLATFKITRVANITGLDNISIPVVAAYRPDSRSIAVSQGKGLSLASAKVSAIMESIELFHAEYISKQLIFGSYNELKKQYQLVDVDQLPRIKKSRFHKNLQLLWIEGFDLITKSNCWIPFEMVNMSSRIPVPSGSGCFPSNSNGLASGNHIQEAILHAICEVVERDSTTLWEQKSDMDKAQTAISIDSIKDEYCCQLLEKIHRSGNKASIWETTSDIGVPAFICEITNDFTSSVHAVHSFTGMGCHVNKCIALSRAITEAVQCRLTLISGARDDLNYKDYKNFFREDHVVVGRYDRLDNYKPERNFDCVCSFDGHTFSEDIQYVMDRIKSIGILNIIIVDLRKEEYNIPVVKVIIPGLEGPDDEPDYLPGLRAQKK